MEEGPSLDHYEEQLYSMFKSFDVNNEESLDESAVHDLCDALQLEERGAALADSLFERSTDRVTFSRFRSGLLAVLGEQASAAPQPRVRLDHAARIDGEEALALCRDLRMDAIDAGIVERIFEDAPGADTSVGEFFERLDASLDGAGRGALLAALAAARAQAAAAGAELADARAERDKLRADAAEADARAALLAREVDESQARLEAELTESLRRAEARHAEAARSARADADAELERWRAERARLAADAARLGAELTERRASCAELAALGAALEERARAAESALAETRAERARLAERLAEARADGEEAARLEARAVAAETRLAALTRTHARLRDRADELAAALEAARPAPPAPRLEPDASLSAELRALLAPAPDRTEDVNVESSVRRSATVEAGVQTEEEEEEEEEGDRVRRLEAGLEAMRVEFEQCEEYWADKQRAERDAHDAELAAADARLAALLAKVQACERRQRPAPCALQAIPEAAALEAQVSALEAECLAARREAELRLQRTRDRLQRTQRRLAALQRRRDPPPACARCGRLEDAERAARQLGARLAAADLLVKDLFVENCRLARAAAAAPGARVS